MGNDDKDGGGIVANYWIWVLVVLLGFGVGLGLGALIWGSGGEPPPPVSSPWPCESCANTGQPAIAGLAGIYKLAELAHDAGTLAQKDYDDVCRLVAKCATNNDPVPKLTPDQHCDEIKQALTAAGDGDWVQCIMHLGHGH